MKDNLIDKVLCFLIEEDIREPVMGDLWERHYQYIDNGVPSHVAYLRTLVTVLSVIVALRLPPVFHSLNDVIFLLFRPGLYERFYNTICALITTSKHHRTNIS